jgi:hypothetical protein
MSYRLCWLLTSGIRMFHLEFFIDIILPAVLWSWGRLSLLQKWVPGIYPGGWRRPVRRADNLTTFMCRLPWNLGASTSWNPQGLPCFAVPFYRVFLIALLPYLLLPLRILGGMVIQRNTTIGNHTVVLLATTSYWIFIQYTKPDLRNCLVNELGVTFKPRSEEGAKNVQCLI